MTNNIDRYKVCGSKKKETLGTENFLVIVIERSYDEIGDIQDMIYRVILN